MPKFLTSRFYKYICFLIGFAPFLAFAQPDDVFAEDAYEPDSLYAVRNAIKFDPVQIVFGDMQFYYEGILSSHWSLEFGFGPTRRNFTASWFDYELDNLGDNVDIKTRFATSLSGRYYFWDLEELSGPYMALGLSYKKFDKTYAVIDSTGELTGHKFDDSRAYTSLMLTGGFQALGMGSNIFADFYFGLGLRYKDFDIVRSADINVPESYFITEEQEFVLGVHAGVKIGFGF